MIHTLALYGSAALIVVLFVGVLTSFEGYIPKHRSNHELCQDVAEEVNIQVDKGMLTQEEADTISNRCTHLFGGDDD